MFKHHLLAFLLVLTSPATFADEAFEANYAKALDNARTERGAAFDAELGKAYAGMADFQAKVSDCLRANPGPHAVRGYIHFLTAKSFQVVVEPKDGFGNCLAPALASPSLPEPPSVPYLNPFSFNFQAPASDATADGVRSARSGN